MKFFVCKLKFIFYIFIAMNLFIFPELARSNNGYGYAVEKDYLRLSPSNDDIVVWYTVMDKEDYQKILNKVL